MSAVQMIETMTEGPPSGLWGQTSRQEFNQGALRKLAFERPALLLFCSSWRQKAEESSLYSSFASHSESRGPDHPAVTVFLASFVELERRGCIEIGPPLSIWSRKNIEGVCATKKIPQVQGSGMAVELFDCISHAYSPVQEIVKKFLASYRKDPWNLHTAIGESEAKAFGYLVRQMWPATGIRGWLGQLGLGSDIETIWARNGLKARAAGQALRILRSHIEEFLQNSSGLYRGLRQSILEGMALGETGVTQHTGRFLHLRKRHAH